MTNIIFGINISINDYLIKTPLWWRAITMYSSKKMNNLVLIEKENDT